ncbi:MAG TPA: tRNA pseudouridine(38-40) synthase TruA [Steroidobacteraceae bacterium]|nr:tRNA pseudouridine(38-40) synthase TruA [Steroidobacteraceae bacterium]
MPRIALGLEYDGSRYRGWQHQAHAISVQDQVEKALAFVANHPIEATSAGRTDAGVHASMQVVHFDAHVKRSERAWVLGANTELPTDISALWAREVPDDFHARYTALARSYRYIILNRQTRPALERDRVCWERLTLNTEVMHKAAQVLIGEHDFSSFRAAECQSSTPMRRVESIAVRRYDERVIIDITANAFLHHMVRNIAGVLIAIGVGDRHDDWCEEVLNARDRRLGGVTAPPQGLTLVGVRYPTQLALPSDVNADVNTCRAE